MRKTTEDSEKLNIGIEYPQRRFGVVAMEKNFINADQLWEALVRQKSQDSGLTERRHIGMILKDLGYLSFSQLNEVLQAMEGNNEPRGSAFEVPKHPGPRRKAPKSKKKRKST